MKRYLGSSKKNIAILFIVLAAVGAVLNFYCKQPSNGGVLKHRIIQLNIAEAVLNSQIENSRPEDLTRDFIEKVIANFRSRGVGSKLLVSQIRQSAGEREFRIESFPSKAHPPWAGLAVIDGVVGEDSVVYVICSDDLITLASMEIYMDSIPEGDRKLLGQIYVK